MSEKYYKHIFCEKKFLEHCISTIDNWNFCEENFVELQLWRCIKKMIFSSDIILHLDITNDYIDDIENRNPKERSSIEKVILEIVDRQQSNSDREPGIQLKNSDFVPLQNFHGHNNEQLTAYYLTICDFKTCQKYMEEYGILVICPENIINFKGILYDNGGTIDKNESKGWKDLIKINPKLCNSMILIDNYIFSHSNTIDQKDNLLKILDILLPQSLNADITFHISIFTSDIDWDIKWQVESDEKIDKMSKIDKFYQMLAKSIERLRPNLCFLLCVFKCQLNEFHDRILVTNNFYISSGGGFDLIRKDGKSDKMTTTNIVYPYLNCSAKWVNSAYSNVISNAASVYNSKRLTKLKNESDRTAYLGNKINRLLKMI